MKTLHWCEKCYKQFDDEASCRIHETFCEDYQVGDRVEVFYEEKWWAATVTVVLKTSKCEKCGGKKERFMAVRTDEQFDRADGIMYTGYDMGIGEDTGDKTSVRRLVEQTSAGPRIKRMPDTIIPSPGSSSIKRG